MSAMSFNLTAMRQFAHLKSFGRPGLIFDNDLPFRFRSLRFLSNTSKVAKVPIKDEWFLAAAVCVEKIPTLTPLLTEFEQKMLSHLRQTEYERSMKSDFELRQAADIEAAEKRKLEGLKISAGARTAEDDSDAWKKDLAAFIPAPKKIRAGENSEIRSTERALDKPLHLLVERNLGNMESNKEKPFFCWDLPTCIRKDEESMREVAERALRDSCGSQLKVDLIGNAPWAFYKYKYPKRIQDKTGKCGEKVFIYKAHYKSGNVSNQEHVARDYKWCYRHELKKVLDPETNRALSEILYDDEYDFL